MLPNALQLNVGLFPTAWLKPWNKIIWLRWFLILLSSSFYLLIKRNLQSPGIIPNSPLERAPAGNPTEKWRRAHSVWMPEVMAHTGKIKLLVILLSFQHPFRNDVMRKRRFSPFQSLKEDFGTSDEGTTLGEPGVGDKYAEGCPLGSQQNLGAGNTFPHPEEISSLLQTPLWGKTWETWGKSSPQHTESEFGSPWTRNDFSPRCVHTAKDQNLGLVIVWCKNSWIEVWVLRYLARHVYLMWIKDYMVELSKYNQCNMIHSCPAQQMLEQMSGKKKNCWGVSALFWISAFKRREYLY